MTTASFLLTGLAVGLSALVVPAWRNKYRAGSRAGAVNVFSLLILAAAGVATIPLALEVVSLGGRNAPSQSHSMLLGSIFGVPVVVVPLALLVAVVGVVELRARAVRTVSTAAAPAASERTAATAPAIPRPSFDSNPRRPHMPSRTVAHRHKIHGPATGAPREMPGRVVHGHARTLDAIRGELGATGLSSSKVLLDVIAQIEWRMTTHLEAYVRTQTSTRAAVGRLEETVTDQATDVAHALQRVADLCVQVTDRIETHRLERPVLVDAIALLARSDITPPDVSPTIVAEVTSVADDAHAPDPAPARLADQTWLGPSGGGSAVFMSVERLRQRAQHAGQQLWTRTRRPGRSGRTPVAVRRGASDTVSEWRGQARSV